MRVDFYDVTEVAGVLTVAKLVLCNFPINIPRNITKTFPETFSETFQKYPVMYRHHYGIGIIMWLPSSRPCGYNEDEKDNDTKLYRKQKL